MRVCSRLRSLVSCTPCPPQLLPFSPPAAAAADCAPFVGEANLRSLLRGLSTVSAPEPRSQQRPDAANLGSGEGFADGVLEGAREREGGGGSHEGGGSSVAEVGVAGGSREGKGGGEAFLGTEEGGHADGHKGWVHQLSGGQTKVFDVAIVGGGMVGAAMAASLATSAATRHLRIALVDSQPPSQWPAATSSTSSPTTSASSTPDPRVVAVSPATVGLLSRVGAWQRILKSSARRGAFTDMQVWEYAGNGFVRYAARDVGQDTLGFIVENKTIVGSLHSILKSSPSVAFLAPSRLQSISWPPGPSGLKSNPQTTGTATPDSAWHATSAADLAGLHCPDWPVLELEGGARLQARLIVAADGGRSKVRSLAGFRTLGWSYHQRAAIATVQVASSCSTAFQRFLPTGPLALLPIGDNFCNVVWSTTEQHAKELENSSGEKFAAAVNDEYRKDFHHHQPWAAGHPLSFAANPPFSDYLPGNKTLERLLGSTLGLSFQDFNEEKGGFVEPPKVLSVQGPILSFPLSLSSSVAYVAPRLALVGDAAHTVHPLAGQGVNLGFADVAALQACLEKAIDAGEDFGEVDLLRPYERERRVANAAMQAGLDGLQKLFSSKFWLVGRGRNLGLSIVNSSPLLKKQIMAVAMGLGS